MLMIVYLKQIIHLTESSSSGRRKADSIHLGLQCEWYSLLLRGSLWVNRLYPTTDQ